MSLRRIAIIWLSFLILGTQVMKAHGKSDSFDSLLTVDPSKILSLMIRHGELLIPRALKSEFDLLGKVCHTSESKLNVVGRELILRNFTLSLPGEKENALRVGRVRIRWDSYLKPCIDVEVDDVNILIEFLNVMLTRNNWKELNNLGFPPVLLDTAEKKSSENSFIRLKSIVLMGGITTRLRSRPLNKDISVLNLDMNTASWIASKVQKRSEENLIQHGQRGCTTEDFYKICEMCLTDQLHKLFQKAVNELTEKELRLENGLCNALQTGSKPFKTLVNNLIKNAANQADEAMLPASQAVLTYTTEARIKKGNDVQKFLKLKLRSQLVNTSNLFEEHQTSENDKLKEHSDEKDETEMSSVEQDVSNMKGFARSFTKSRGYFVGQNKAPGRHGV